MKLCQDPLQHQPVRNWFLRIDEETEAEYYISPSLV